MIRLTVLYPNLKGSRFDWDYYVNVHTPLAKKRFGDHVLKWEIDRGIEGEGSGEPAPYQVAAYITLTSLEDFRKVMEEHGKELKGDFPNYTNVYPQFLISEIAVS
ncbi:MAG: EthD family reductase [Chloroflexi bacterium]|nr:EthD family reductase [Chloroflexota bacterium]MCZ6867136.1 EthD family reductase [Chloroflexota bacterium]